MQIYRQRAVTTSQYTLYQRLPAFLPCRRCRRRNFTTSSAVAGADTPPATIGLLGARDDDAHFVENYFSYRRRGLF